MSTNILIANYDPVRDFGVPTQSASKTSDSDMALTDDMARVDPVLVDWFYKKLEFLHTYLIVAESVPDMLDINVKRTILPKLSYGLRKSGELLGNISYYASESEKELKRARAIAALDEFNSWVATKKIEGKEIKITDATREHYLHIDPNVSAAHSRYSLLLAMRIQAQCIKQEFVMALAGMKSMLYGVSDDAMLSGISAAVNERE
jgi:hypothetical protein